MLEVFGVWGSEDAAGVAGVCEGLGQWGLPG